MVASNLPAMAQRMAPEQPPQPSRLLLLLLPLLLLLRAAAVSALAAGPEWVEAQARHGQAAARACRRTGRVEVSLLGARQDDSLERRTTLALAMEAVGFQHQGRWLSPGKGLLLEAVEVKEEEGKREWLEDEGVGCVTPASACGALGPSALLSLQWRAEEEEEEERGGETGEVGASRLCGVVRPRNEGMARPHVKPYPVPPQ